MTHEERVIDSHSGVTKGELAAYYADVSALMRPHLRARPVALLRAPDGVDGPVFFQKHADADEFPGIARLDAALDPGHAPLLAVPTQKAMLAAVQMNVIEFHTWNATTRAIDRPDRLVFDLDPGSGVSWPRMQEAARLLHALLEELGLTSFLKTSGGQGLHIVVPLAPRFGWDAVRGFAHALVQHMASTHPERFVARSGPKNRIGKIFIDYLRNGFGATTVCAWSARARPGLGVSVPVAWDELDALSGSNQWTVRTFAARVDLGNAPWSGYADARQPLTAAMKALQYEPANEKP
jgi:bifunctional non-homologous end joining protein LigD